MVVAIGLRVKQYILLFAVLSFVYFMKRGFLLSRRNTNSSIATKHAPSSVEASARDPHFHDITCVFSLAASRIAILNHESAVLCLFKDQCRTAAQSYYKDYKEIIALRAAWDRTQQLAANWPRVPSDRCVVFSVAQYPDEAHGAKVDDAEGLLKLASEQCANCLNPYHITLDCPHRRRVLNRQWWVTLLQSTIRHWW